MIQTTEKSRNVHIMDLPKNEKECKLLLISDLHWDNPKCERKLLKKHLDEAKEKGAKVVINGDFFCLMQGKGDPRRNKDDIETNIITQNTLIALLRQPWNGLSLTLK